MNKLYIKHIQDLSFQFAKYHYNEYIKKHSLSYIVYDKVHSVVSEVYSKELQKQLFAFIRSSMKNQLEEQYNPMLVEPLLQEIANDPSSAIDRIVLEIHEHQKKFYKLNEVP